MSRHGFSPYLWQTSRSRPQQHRNPRAWEFLLSGGASPLAPLQWASKNEVASAMQGIESERPGMPYRSQAHSSQRCPYLAPVPCRGTSLGIHAPATVDNCKRVRTRAQLTCVEAGPRRLGDQAMPGFLTHLRNSPSWLTPRRNPLHLFSLFDVSYGRLTRGAISFSSQSTSPVS
jgi:hypothetical protein